jgi:hypothetical protein
MLRFSHAAIATAWLLVGSGVSAQQSPRFIGQAVLSTATRTVTDQLTAATRGVQVMARGGLLVRPNLGLVGQATLATFPDQRTLGVCPVGIACLPALSQVPGLGVAGLAVGLQPRLHAGPIALLLTASAGGYWLYHHRPDMPATAPGVGGAVAAGMPITSRVHILLEASVTHLLRQGVSDANTRHVGLGLALH